MTSATGTESSEANLEAGIDDPARKPVRCVQPNELYQFPSRTMMGSLLRSFLDQVIITPSELLHSMRYQIRLDQAGNLLKDAVEKAGTIQARQAGESVPVRVRELHDLVTNFMLNSRNDDKLPLKPLREGQFNERMGEINAEPISEEAKHVKIYRTLTEYLSGVRTWAEKLEKIVAMGEETDDRYLDFVDVLVGEILQCEVVMDNLLGRRISLETRLEDLIEIYSGTYPTRRPTAASTIAPRLQTLLLRHRMTETRAALETIVVQLLGGRDPLCSPELLTELKAAHAMIGKLRAKGHQIGGKRAMEYLERRVSRLLTSESVTDYVRGSLTLSDRMQSLVEIHNFTVGDANKKTIEEFISRYFTSDDFGRRLLTVEGSPEHKFKLLAQLYRSILRSNLSAETRENYCKIVAGIQNQFLVESNFFATIEKKVTNTAKKMSTVLALCHEGAFIPGANLDLAKSVIRHYLSRPDFYERLYEGASNAQQRDEQKAKLLKLLAPLAITLPNRG
ncbi:MAG: hypothetical protein QM523_06320 [Candidatus Pacebacteria bacterium]|nr:hypothetical protein [Candidatus Paceibacterota bacterium]